MKKYLIFSTFILLFGLSCSPKKDCKCGNIYIITTNDIHANINMMPQLATLVKEYEACGEVILCDSGDRVTGNAFVDDAPEPGLPMIELMNSIGYDVATFGNHEFDKGSKALTAMIEAADFDFVCANISAYPEGFPHIEPYVIYNVQGIALGFAGVVDTDSKGRPLGGDSAYTGFSFTADISTAFDTGRVLAPKSDFTLLLSHMGYKQDRALAEQGCDYAYIAGGHSHDMVGESLCNTFISQNGKNLHSVTVASIELCDGKISDVEFKRETLNRFDADPSIAAIVADIKSRNTELCNIEGRATAHATQDGVANFTVAALANYPYADGFSPEVSFYHFGGVRLTNILAGDITRGDIYNNDPFQSTIFIGEMTTTQIREFILDKYNSGSPDSPDKESHYPYFRCDHPYTIVLGEEPEAMPDAIDIIFDLEEGRSYRVAMCNYIAENYIDRSTVNQQLRATGVSVREAMLHYLHSLDGGFTPDNTIYQIEATADELNM